MNTDKKLFSLLHSVKKICYIYDSGGKLVNTTRQVFNRLLKIIFKVIWRNKSLAFVNNAKVSTEKRSLKDILEVILGNALCLWKLSKCIFTVRCFQFSLEEIFTATKTVEKCFLREAINNKESSDSLWRIALHLWVLLKVFRTG